MRWLIRLVHIVFGLLPVTSGLWAESLRLETEPSRFFTSANSYLNDELEEMQVSLDQVFFPQQRGNSPSSHGRAVRPATSSPTLGFVVALSSVDPWDEEPGRVGEARISEPGVLELEWEAPRREGYNWGGAIGQTLLFTTVGHVFRVATEEKTRRELDGPFFKDWFKSAGSLFSSGWSDGGRDFTNYVIHPLSGSVYGHIYRQNHPQDRDIRVSLSKDYFGHLAKTTAFSFVASLAWEIGPYSEASIGNVGLYNSPESQQMTWGDIVVTPLIGVWGIMVIEDLFERYVIRKVEGKTANRWIKALFRIPLTPTRSAANLMAIKRPDYRPDRQ